MSAAVMDQAKYTAEVDEEAVVLRSDSDEDAVTVPREALPGTEDGDLYRVMARVDRRS